FAEQIREALGDRAVFAQRMQRMNLAASVAEIGGEKLALGETISYSELVPEYLRLSQAERERLEKESKK
ncbi:MAG: tRNA (adenosine(37)-N6)-threonylcarbamoyltransferase complex dimerization subunit type 1 TsaB, partial [Clostridia bacterium]|nr:tRNA (adenosine(37)-N6)-threonylcarbamoyltransferase complex dimerization subunit type 1 TsaB [Clostridia bacterium]